MRVVYFGTPSFAAEILDFLLQKQISIAAVVSQPPRPKGRNGSPVSSPVALLAAQNDLPLHEPLKATDPEFIETLRRYEADLFIVVAYGKILRPAILEMPKQGCLNVHASLLPKYRGAAPMQRCLMEGEPETGITIMYLTEEMDAGDMIHWAKTEIGPNTTLDELEETLCALGKTELLATIEEIGKHQVVRIPQDHKKATFAPKVTTDDCCIQWSQPAVQLHNLIRGVRGRPGAWCQVAINGKPQRIKIDRSMCVPGRGAPGEVLHAEEGHLVVACGNGALELLTLQPEGKRLMSGAEFLRGTHNKKVQFQ